MTYIQRHLVRGETVGHIGRFHWTEKMMAILLAPILIGLFSAFRMWTTEFAVTSHRVIHKRGWLFRKTEEMRLSRIEEVNVQQSLYGRVMGFGTVSLSGSGGNSIKLPRMANPERFRNAIHEAAP